MASSEYGGGEDSEVLLEGDVYKATSSSNYVVVRRVRLYRSKFITFHNIDENEDNNKQWILTSQCELQPRTSSEVRERCTKFVRPRGQWAITTFVKPKSIGATSQPVLLYMFTLAWPTRWAAKGYTSFSFGFETLDVARHWHNRISECIEIRLEKAPSSLGTAYSAQPSQHARVSTGATGSSNGGPVVPAASFVAAGHFQSPEESKRQMSNVETAKRALVYDNGSRGASADGTVSAVSASTANSSFASASAATAVVAAGIGAAAATAAAPSTAGEAAAPLRPAAPKPKALAAAAAATTASRPPAQVPEPGPSAVFVSDGAFSPSSSDSDGEDGGAEGDGSRHGRHPSGRNASGMLATGAAACRVPRGTARGDVRHAKQRWVPYKQVNGVAIYHRPQTAGDAEAGVGGEFMVSTVVRGSPRRCLDALTSNCGTTTILGPAMSLEVLQRRQTLDGKEIQRIILQAPGVTGVICAPRELVVETVFKTDDTGPTLVLMFNSCEPPARFVEMGSGADPQHQPGETEGVQTASAGVRRSWWGRPVAARVRGGYTVAPLEEYSLDNSPEALVTCIMKVDLGGVCGERSWVRLAADLVGWTDAFLDRMLMAVTLLRDEVEQGRFVVQPLSMMASSKVKERERDGSSVLDIPGLCTSRSTEAIGLAACAGGVAGGAAAGGLGRRSARLPPAARPGGGSRTVASSTAGACSGAVLGRTAIKAPRREVDRPTLVDGPAGDVTDVAPAAGAAGADGGSLAADAAASSLSAVVAEGSVLMAGSPESSIPASPSAQPDETMEDVLFRMRSLSFLDPQVWDNLHQPDKDAPFKIRGPTYLKDRKKIPAGYTRFVLGSMDVIQLPPGPVTEHVARFIPAIRESGAPFSLIIHLVIPGNPLLGIVATFVTDRPPSALGSPPAHPMEDEHDWEPFDFVLHKYMNGSTHTRNHMLKLIPHIADGSWMIKQSVGTTPVILGKQLRTIYYETPQYIEIDIDISANNVASYVTGLVRGATRSLVIDMGFVLEATTPWELPEALLGTLRLYNLDIRNAKPIDTSHEIPLRPPTVPIAAGPSTAASAAGPAPPSAPVSSVKLPQAMTTTTPPSAAAGQSSFPPVSSVKDGSAGAMPTVAAVAACGGGGGSGSAPVSSSGVTAAASVGSFISRHRPSASVTEAPHSASGNLAAQSTGIALAAPSGATASPRADVRVSASGAIPAPSSAVSASEPLR